MVYVGNVLTFRIQTRAALVCIHPVLPDFFVFFD
jgi:hypothetical protein